MAVLSDHHWSDRIAGLRELRRIARRRVVLFNADPAESDRFWLTVEYLPSFLALIPEPYRRPGCWAPELARELGELRIEPVPIRTTARTALRRLLAPPEAYLDDRVRRGISVFARLPEREVAEGLEELAADLASGAWRDRHRELRNREQLDLGYRIAIAELD